MRNIVYGVFGFALLAGSVWSGASVSARQADMVKTHIGHVMTSFTDTPNSQGLLATALAEAKTAAEHVALAEKAANDLLFPLKAREAMVLHAGHVIHAIDPSVEPTGPGLNYGVKKAAAGIAQHIGLAAKAQGASKNVITYAAHVSASANNVVKRSDELVALAQKVREAVTATEMVRYVDQLTAKAKQLVAGVDANKDGKITWEPGEGGLQQVEMEMQLMLKEGS